MKQLIYVSRRGSIATVNFQTSIPVNSESQPALFEMGFDTGDIWSAELLARHMRAELSDAVSKAKREAYESGWRDAKAHNKKQDYFGGWLDKA